jgi:thiamine pyrophosphokinase
MLMAAFEPGAQTTPYGSAPRPALIVGDGDVEVALLRRCLDVAEPPLLVAADGGAASVLEAGLQPDLVVGDLDSLPARERVRLESLGVDFRVASPDKDESDMELCLLAAIEAGARRIDIIGAMGLVRPEHSVANLLLLADPRFDQLELAILARGSSIRRVGTVAGPGRVTVRGEPRDFISLFALDPQVEGVTTVGLRFPLVATRLPLGTPRGLSNEMLGQEATVSSTRGRLLVIHTSGATATAPAVPVDRL